MLLEPTDLFELEKGETYVFTLQDDRLQDIYIFVTNNDYMNIKFQCVYDLVQYYNDYDHCANLELMKFDRQSETYKVTIEDSQGKVIYKNTII